MRFRTTTESSTDNWLALATCRLPPLLGFMRRIVLEEAVPREELGDAYKDYSPRTKRLIPGIWTL